MTTDSQNGQVLNISEDILFIYLFIYLFFLNENIQSKKQFEQE